MTPELIRRLAQLKHVQDSTERTDPLGKWLLQTGVSITQTHFVFTRLMATAS